ncbi:hypothetical protein HPT25_14890 [Bacillus sp. BRMEA1]|uniref:hypothetical protein n=1 Tax=Neobacillus endophyticus TaxID=2738405 RepID=UPI00156320E8|nr:hypothetical protein [Neobacillus endophyticus]NRD78645.1 hypothetical protein [Neobacillus endophyticus]
MAQKKSDAALAVAEKEMPKTAESRTELEFPAEGSFVNTFWDQVERSREHVRKLRESREDAYLTAVREVINFNKKYRNSIAKLYEQTKKTNKEMVSELTQQINTRKEEIMEADVQTTDREELKKQLKEVSGQLEKLAFTPVRSIFQLIDGLEERFEKNAETSIAFARGRRNAWFEVRREYVNLARNTHLNLVERGKNSLKELVKI